MEYKATYSIEGGPEYQCTVLLARNRVVINYVNEFNLQRTVYWDYDIIVREHFTNEGMTKVRTSGYPIQHLVSRNRELGDMLESMLSRKRDTWKGRATNLRSIGLLKVVIVVILFLVALYFWLVPYLAGRMAMRVPVSYEQGLGNNVYSAMRRSMKIDEKKSLYANEFFTAMKIPSDYNIRITVVRDSQVNAFAIPGGHIVVYDAIIDKMEDYEEFAALISHEFTHIQKRHSLRSMFRSLGSTMFFAVIFGDLGVISNVIINNADQLKSLEYSRKLEKEADLNGVKLLSERQISSQGFVDLFEILKTSSPGAESAEWISSHPALDKRKNYVMESGDFSAGVPNPELSAIFRRLKAEENTY